MRATRPVPNAAGIRIGTGDKVRAGSGTTVLDGEVDLVGAPEDAEATLEAPADRVCAVELCPCLALPVQAPSSSEQNAAAVITRATRELVSGIT